MLTAASIAKCPTIGGKKFEIRCKYTLMAESEEELKSLLIKVKEESEKVGLKS